MVVCWQSVGGFEIMKLKELLSQTRMPSPPLFSFTLGFIYLFIIFFLAICIFELLIKIFIFIKFCTKLNYL